jgi:uncharacterized glyoxalase superfamily protein PhnB
MITPDRINIAFMKLTPVLIVDEIEKSLPFWVDRVGFTKTAEMPEGDRLGFVILDNGGTEVMLQSVESVRKDEPKFVPKGEAGSVSFYIEVDSFEDIVQRLEGYPILMPERTTFYGMREIGVRDPAGNGVIFAVRVRQQAG